MVGWTNLILFLPGTFRALHHSPNILRESSSNNDALDANKLSSAMQTMGYSPSTQESIQDKLDKVGLSSCIDLENLARDFVDRPEVFSSLLQSDFGLSPLIAHQTRAAVMLILEQGDLTRDNKTKSTKKDVKEIQVLKNSKEQPPQPSEDDGSIKLRKRPNYKSVIVNEKAKKRRQSRSQSQKHEYGLPSNYRSIYPTLTRELDEFHEFMTRPSTASQESPLRPATADVYMRHARLFLGWYVTQHMNKEPTTMKDLSLESVVANKEKESAAAFLNFIMWLRSTRNISVSYEANVLRGLIKLLKFRFCKESTTDPTYGEKSFADIPLIRELRKLHRDANKRQTMSSRSSDEEIKWLSWSEYLQVIQAIKQDLLQLLDKHENNQTSTNNTSKSATSIKKKAAAKKKIATTYQHYLVLAFFASVPDRQRTIRELEIGKSFVKDEKNGVFVVKHGSDDYKTGKTYGDRPPLVLSKELVPAIDDFLENWRPCLVPKTDYLFVQPRTGNPLTQDSVYQIVGRSCYKYTGKKTNPHLLRDMIVTHVRDSDASEKELEALALYMGHSIQMQRTSYDRRTLTKKVAPAVELLQSVNKNSKK